jgi:hypothetical protein
MELVMEIISDIVVDPHVADYGYSIYYQVLATDDPAPASSDQFLHFGFTRRKKELINRTETERGKKKFCIKLENAKGLWRPIFWTIIP